MISRRKFIKRGALVVPTIFVPTWFRCAHGSVMLAALDPEVENWMNVRVPANGGTVTPTSVVANDAWMKIVKGAALRSGIRRANTYTGFDLGACTTALIADCGPSADVNGGFVAGDYSESTGLGSASVGSLSTGCSASNAFGGTNDGHMALYNRTNQIDSNLCMGALQGGSQVDWMVVGNTGNLTSCSMHDAGSGAVNFTGDTDPRGFYHLVRTASNVCILYKNGVQVASNAGTVGTITNIAIFIHCYHDITLGAQLKTSKRLAGYSMGPGAPFTAAQSLIYSYAWQTLETICARQV